MLRVCRVRQKLSRRVDGLNKKCNKRSKKERKKGRKKELFNEFNGLYRKKKDCKTMKERGKEHPKGENWVEGQWFDGIAFGSFHPSARSSVVHREDTDRRYLKGRPQQKQGVVRKWEVQLMLR